MLLRISVTASFYLLKCNYSTWKPPPCPPHSRRREPRPTVPEPANSSRRGSTTVKETTSTTLITKYYKRSGLNLLFRYFKKIGHLNQFLFRQFYFKFQLFFLFRINVCLFIMFIFLNHVYFLCTMWECESIKENNFKHLKLLTEGYISLIYSRLFVLEVVGTIGNTTFGGCFTWHKKRF